MMKVDYVTLFAERRWKEAFDAMPLNVQKAVKIQSPGDAATIRVRASEYNKTSEWKRVSVSIDYGEGVAMVKVGRK